jgi:hypothetical protein
VNGGYAWRFWCNDTSGNSRLSNPGIAYTVTQNVSSCSLSSNGPVTYPASLTVSSSCSSTESALKLYKDGVDITNKNGIATTWAAGSYNFSVNVSSTQNYTGASQSAITTVVQGAGDVDARLNGQRTDITLAAGSTIPLNATVVNAAGQVQLELNGAIIASGTTSVQVSQNFASTGVYNITARYLGNQNYTTNAETWFATVTSSSPNLLISFVSPTPSNASSSTGSSIFVNVSSSGYEHYVANDFARSLVLWLRMDDLNASNDPVDLSSYSNNGSKQGNAAQSLSGRFGKSFAFDGVGDSVVVKDSASLYVNNKFTVSLWFYLNNLPSVGNNYQLLEDGGEHDIDVGTYVTGTVLEAYDGNDLIGTTPLVTNRWYHAVYTHNGTAARLYLDTALQGTVSGSATVPDTGANIRLGQHGGFGRDLNGFMDEVLIFNRSLSTPEILALYNASAFQYSANITGLTAGTYVYRAAAVDVFGNTNGTDYRSNTLQSAPQCSDGLDNDGDGATDGADFACQQGGANENSFTAQCQDTVDNDGGSLSFFAVCSVSSQ